MNSKKEFRISSILSSYDDNLLQQKNSGISPRAYSLLTNKVVKNEILEEIYLNKWDPMLHSTV